MHELVPDVPLRHGHAISIDMAYSATLAKMRGLLSDHEHHRLLNLFSRAGLSMDHPQFDAEILDRGTQAILKTRDGKLRAAVPHPLGKCIFLNDVSLAEMTRALDEHRKIMKGYPRQGAGIDAFVDSSDTGYTRHGQAVEDCNGSTGIVKNGFTQVDPVGGAEEQQSRPAATMNGWMSATHNARKHEIGTEDVDGLHDTRPNTVRNGVEVLASGY
jgi:3-dehydroquinate synthase